MPGLRSRLSWSSALSALSALSAPLALTLWACLGLLGCAADNSAPELLKVIDVAPREVDVGDRIEVLGTDLRTGEGGHVGEAKVTFKGELRRPGQAPVEAEITVDKAQVSTAT